MEKSFAGCRFGFANGRFRDPDPSGSEKRRDIEGNFRCKGY